MAWTQPMIHALLLRAPAGAAITRPLLLRTQAIAPAAPLRVATTNRPARSPNPRGVSAETASGYAKRR